MTRATLRRGFALAASLALLVGIAPAATFAQDEKQPTNIMHYFTKEFGEAAFLELLDQYTTETGNEVKINPVGHEDYKVGILVQLAGGNPPDMYTDWAGARAAFRVGNGLVAPIDDMWAANDLDAAFPKGLIDSAATYDGVKYVLPLDYHVAGFWYNPAVMEQAGVAIPTTWDELKAACETLKGAGVTPFALGSKDKWPAQFWFDYILLRTAGPEYRARLMAGEAAYTDPEVVKAMQLWGELLSAGCFNADANAKTYTDAADMVANGTAAMTLMGTWIVGYWTPKDDPQEPLIDYDFFPFPAIDLDVNTAVVGPVDALAVAAQAANPDGGKALLAFFARPDVQTRWAAGQGNLPPHVDAELPANPTMVKAAELAATAATFNFNYDLATPPAPSEVGLDMFQKFIDDPSNIEGLLAETQTAIAAAFENQ